MDNIFNGVNLKTTFNADVTNAANVLWAFPDAKTKLEHDFPELNGKDTDLTNPTFSARTFTLNFVVSGQNTQELSNNYFGLWNFIRVEGKQQYYNSFVNLSVYIYYEKQLNLTSPYENNKGGMSIKFDLVFSETNPFDNMPNIYLVDDQNRFLVP